MPGLATEAVVGPILFVGLIIFIAGMIKALVTGARRHGAAAAEALGLAPVVAGELYAGIRGGLALRLAPNALWRAGDSLGEPGVIAPSTSGQIVVVAELPSSLPYALWLQGEVGGGRPYPPGLVKTGDRPLDHAYSLVTADPPAALRLLADPVVRGALMRLHGKHYALVDVTRHEVALQSAHHRRAVELADDAIALARLIAERGA